MTSLIRRSVLIICMLAVAAQASAEVVLLSQSRSVYGYVYAWSGTFPDQDSEFLSAPDFDLFDEEINIGAYTLNASADASSIQESDIQTGHFLIHGSATASALGGDWIEPGSGYADGRSDFEVIFEVVTPELYSLTGYLVFASLQLDWNGEPYLSFNLDGNEEISVSEDGVLEPGTYTLTVNASAEAESESNEYYSFESTSFDIAFEMETAVAVEEMGWGQLKALFR